MTAIVKRFPSLYLAGSIYQFEHLVPFAIDLVGHGQDNSALRVRISFQSHVFSQSLIHNATDFDFRDEGGNKRRFCPDRFKLSENLKTACADLLENNAYTWESEDKNRFSNLAVIDGELISGRHHLIVYYLFPSQVDNLDVEMVVKSAYEKDINFSNIKRRYKIIQLVKKSFYNKKKVP